MVDLGPIGKALYTARYLLSIRGPDRRSNPYTNLAKVKNPILIVQGTADKLVAPTSASGCRPQPVPQPCWPALRVPDTALRITSLR